MRIAYDNLIDDLTSTAITISSAVVTGFSILNVQDERLGIIWKSDSVSVQTIMFELPIFVQYPDGASNVVYFQEDWSTTDSFITSGASALAVSNGTLIANNNASRSITTSGLSSCYAIAKIKSTEGTSSFTICQSSSTFSYINASLPAGEWKIIGGNVNTPSTVTSNIFLVDNIDSANKHFIVDWLYVGNGAFTALSVIEDISDNNKDGTAIGIISEYDYSLEKRVISFFGENTSEVYNSSISLTTEDDISFCGWIYIDGSWTWDTSNRMQIIGIGDNGQSLGIINSLTDGNIHIAYVDDSSNIVVSSAVSIIKNSWIHVAGIYNGKTTKTASLYLNGSLMATTITAATSLISLGTSFNVGGCTSLPSSFGSGILMKANDIRLYRRALSSGDVLKLYQGTEFFNSSTSLMLRWDINEDYKVQVAGILGHNIVSGTKILIEGNDSNAWNSPSVSKEMIAYSGNILNYFTTSSVYKYWRFSIYQADLEIGRFWLSKYLTINPSSVVAFEVINRTSDKVIINDARQKFASVGTKWREIKLSFPKTNTPMLESLLNMYNEVGISSSIIFCNFDLIRDYSFVEPLYSVFDGDLTLKITNNLKTTYDIKLVEVK